MEWMRGNWDEAMIVAQPLLDPANWQAGSFALSRALPALTHLLVNRGQLEDAEAVVALRAPAATTAGLVERADYFTALAMISRARGDFDTAGVARQEILRIVERMGVFHETTRESIAEAIEISLDAREFEEAEQLITALKGRMVVMRDYLAPYVARFEPRLAAARGDQPAAEEGFRAAMDLVRRSEVPFVVAAAQFEYAEWLLGRGRPEEAMPLLSEARAEFERLGARPWLDRIAAMQPGTGATLSR